jgi:hypothetical protein
MVLSCSAHYRSGVIFSPRRKRLTREVTLPCSRGTQSHDALRSDRHIACVYTDVTVSGISAAALLLLTLPFGTGGYTARPAPTAVQIEMRNVRLHVLPDVVLEITRLRGEMVSKTQGSPPVFDDQRSYVLHLAFAEMSLDMASLTNLMNRQVFAYEGAPIEDLAIRADGDCLEQKGKLRKGLKVPFSMKASVAVTPDGRLKLHTESLKAVGIPAKGLLGFFGLELDDLMDLERRRGIEVDGNDIILAPGEVLPPPQIAGRLSRVEVRGNRLLQVFGAPKSAPPLSPPVPRANYIYFSGGDIRFGKLTMSGADLQLIDADPKDPFDFFPERYHEQLVAGYSKNTPRKGLKTFMPDYDDLRRHPPRVSGRDKQGSGGM